MSDNLGLPYFGCKRVTLSGSCYTGTSTVARLLMHETRWAYQNVGEIARAICKEKGVDITRLNELSATILYEIDNRVRERMGNAEKCIWEGRLAGWFTRDQQTTLRVLLTAETSSRVDRAMRRDGLTHSDAQEYILTRDNADKRLFQRLYNVNPLIDYGLYQLIIDTTNVTAETVVASILKMIYYNSQKSDMDL